jgi:hypothetical protein
MTEEINQQHLTFEQAEALFKGGLIGTIEFRNWLARTYSDFSAVRDNDVDDNIREMAAFKQKQFEAQQLLGVA